MAVEILPSAYLFTGMRMALSVIALRAFPFLVAFFVSAERPALRHLAALLGYSALLTLAVVYSGFHSVDLLIAYGYLCAVSTIPYFLRLPYARITLFPFVFTILFVVPALLWRDRTILLFIGWEVSLSVYSYQMDAPRSSRTLGNYWFFVLVNPTIAYPRRGTKVASAGVSWPGLARAAAGALSIGFPALLASARTSLATAEMSTAALVGAGSLRAVEVYATHWGLASIQIGLFRQLGYAAPERYRQPYLASSPKDFWARWNTYYGSWIRFYVFEPFVRTMRRPYKDATRASRMWIRAGAVLCSFFVIGVLHDLFTSLATHRASAATTLWFAANAVVLLVWETVASKSSRGLRKGATRFAATTTMVGLAVAFAAALP